MRSNIPHLQLGVSESNPAPPTPRPSAIGQWGQIPPTSTHQTTGQWGQPTLFPPIIGQWGQIPPPPAIKLQFNEVNPHPTPHPPDYTSLRLSPKLNSLKWFEAFHFSFCTYLTVYQICRRVTEFLVLFWVAVPYPQIYPRVCAPQAMHCLGVVATSMGRTITDIMEAHRDVLQDMIPPKKHLLRYQPANAQIGLMVRGQGYRNDDLPEKSRKFFYHFIRRQMFRSNLWWCFHLKKKIIWPPWNFFWHILADSKRIRSASYCCFYNKNDDPLKNQLCPI